MDFALSDNQKNIIATFREFGESVFTPESVFQWRKDQGLPDEVVKGFVDRYFALDDQSPDGMGIMSQTLILEELCRCAGAALPFQNDLFNLQIMGGFADETVSSRVLDDYRQTGRLMFSLGVSTRTRLPKTSIRRFLFGLFRTIYQAFAPYPSTRSANRWCRLHRFPSTRLS